MRLADCVWPLVRLGEGMEELARRAGLAPAAGEVLSVPPALDSENAREQGDVARWIEWAAGKLDIEAQAVATTVAEFDHFAAHAGPALVWLNGESSETGAGFVLLLRAARGTLALLAPDLRVHRLCAGVLRDALSRRYEKALEGEIEPVLALTGLTPRARARVRAALLRERIGEKPLAGLWILRLAPTAGFWRQLAQARLPRRVGWMLGVFAVVYALELTGWGLIGAAALNGRLDLTWMFAWVLLVLSLAPLKLLGGWLGATFGLDSGRILKKRLLAGVLKMDLDVVRRQGVGQLLSRVIESQALESLALNGGMAVLVSLLELAFAAWVLSLGAGGIAHVLLLAAWLAVTLWLTRRYIVRMREWTLMRLDMTHQLIECMVGHRTRLAQQWPHRRDEQEDQLLRRYLRQSRRLDHASIAVNAGTPGGWGVIGLLGLAPAFIAGSASPASLAIGFGGLLLAHRAFNGIAAGVSSLASAWIAWQQVAPAFHAAADEAQQAPFMSAAHGAAVQAGTHLIDASQLWFQYQPRGEAVLRGADLTIAHGERLLLEGASGGGKSTLASLLTGLRQPQSGLLLLNGLDRHTLGASWHRHASEAPQFHENHILSGTLGFNLLMGRNWPATEEELEAARQLCVELGLGDLLARMPGGMNQMVGETGWQLSHGEKSRVYLARALLQKSQLTIMDESFAALDAHTLKQCLDCAFARAGTLMVIAHP